MARLEFAILQYLDGKVRIVLKRDQDQLLERLQARVAENVMEGGGHTKGGNRTVTTAEIKEAIDKAFNGLIKEFKDETLTLL